MAIRPLPYGPQGPYVGPKVSYNEGDYRKISKLDRGRAEMAKNERLAAELEREKMWKDTAFQKRLEDLQKSLYSNQGIGGSVGGGVGSQSTAGSYGGSQIGQFGGGGQQTSIDRMMEMNPELATYMQRLRSARLITGPNANPYALGYNFGTLSGKGGYFGKAAPVPDLPESAFGGRGGGGITESRLMEILRQLMGGR